MRLYLDSSAFAKRFLDEPGSVEVELLCAEAEELGLSVICAPEIISALARCLREGKLSSQQYEMLKKQLLIEIADAISIELAPLTINLTIELLENNQIRAMDAIHVACAIVWGTDVFASSDMRQITAARSAGLTVIEV